MSNPFLNSNGTKSWTHQDGDSYLATGITTDGKRFRLQGPWNYIRCINLWRGRKWLLRGGKRYLIQTVYN